MDRRTFLGVGAYLIAVAPRPPRERRAKRPKRPRRGVTYIPASGTPAENGAALHNAITAASYGETIQIDAGGIYEYNLTPPDKGAGTAYITIESTQIASLPEGIRITPAQVGLCATIRTGNTYAAVEFAYGAHHYQFLGINFTTSPAVYAAGSVNPGLVRGGAYALLAQVPHDLIFDRCLFHPYETDPLPARSVVRAITLDGYNVTIKHCSMWDFMGWEPQTATGETVTAATNASPVQVTLSSAHGLSSSFKTLITFGGGTGSWAGLNGTKVATYISATQLTLENYDPDTFALSNVNSSEWGSFSGQTVARLSQVLMQSQGILISMGPGPYLIHNNFIEAYYTQLFTGGGAETMIDPANQVTVTAVGGIDTVTLSGLGDLAVDDLIAFKYAQPQSVSAASAASPCRLTVATHRFPANHRLGPESPGITVAGATGDWTVLNTWFWGKVIDSTHIDLYLDEHLTTPFDTSAIVGALTGTVIWWPNSKGSQDLHWQVGKVTAINPTTKVITYDHQGHPNDPTGGNGAGVPVAVDSPAQFNGTCIHDLTITRNTLSVKAKWVKLFMHLANTANYNGSGPKGAWESKHANNVLVESNIVQLEGGSTDPFDSSGSISINQANQAGATPWVTHNNWIVRNNLFRGCGFFPIGLTEEYESGVNSHGWLIENNLWAHTQSPWLQLIGSTDVTVRHNTIQTTYALKYGYASLCTALAGPNANTVFENNVFNWSLYGYQTLEAPWTKTHTNNYLIDNEAQSFTPPAGDVRVATAAAMGFVDKAAGDSGLDYHGYRLMEGSPGYHAATDGKDVGVDFTQLDIALSGIDPSAAHRGGAFFGQIFRTRY